DLAGVFILSDGLHVNGSRLVAGIASVVGAGVPLTGGLAGDGPDFTATVVGVDFPPRQNVIAAIGFYGPAVRIGYGSAGGWDQFGPRRHITRSDGRVLYELDGKPALDLYERYLGEEAEGLPSSALLFPLRIYEPSRPDHDLVRTVLAVDREAKSMTFAGDMPEGWVAQLMRGNFDRLAAGAAAAARAARLSAAALPAGDEIALLVSCIGRRLLMGQSTVDEVSAAAAELTAGAKRIGFYSYGEISPNRGSGVCQLHNQTMTITTIHEAA
ncbi:MAG TPA: FIST C-terminal domain-containing protein, partial [Bauldia sp.]|nr:FIST C-terminal domain-containing protein [Bauldia sp.]